MYRLACLGFGVFADLLATLALHATPAEGYLAFLLGVIYFQTFKNEF